MARPIVLLIVALMIFAVSVTGTETASTPEEFVYASYEDVGMKAYVFQPQSTVSTEPKAAVVIFHGGGWTIGSAEWGFSLAQHFADLGMVGISAQYRLSDSKSVTPLEGIEDAKAVIRWTRTNADSLGIDPDRVAAYGWSAGAHLAIYAAAYGNSESDDASDSPNLLLLKSPLVATGGNDRCHVPH